MNRIALWALCAFVFTVPMENTIGIPGVGTGTRIVGYVASGLCIWCILLRGYVHKPDTIQVLWLAFVFLAFLSLEWTVDPEMTVVRLGTAVQLLAMMWLIREIALTRKAQQKLMGWLVAGAAISAVATFYAYKTGATIMDTRYAAEGFDPNDLALTFALVIPTAWYLSSNLHRFWSRMFCRACTLLLLAGIPLTGSRGGSMAGVAALLIIPALSKKRNIGTTALFAAGAIAGILAIIPAQSWDRLFTIRDAMLAGTMSHRTELWSAGLREFNSHPVLGVGTAAYSTATGSMLRGADAGRSVAHNTYISILVELGVVGFALFTNIFVVTCKRILSFPKTERRLWGISLLTWCIGVSGLSWEYRKMTWLLFTMIIVQAVSLRHDRLSSLLHSEPEALDETEYGIVTAGD